MSDRGVEDVDLLVIGGGKAGKSLAMDRAKAGWKVAMVERDKIGGTCINVACIPTKALVGSARTVLMARHAEVMGVELGDQPLVSVDGLRRHKSSVVDGMVAAHKKMFADSGMDFIFGVARFIAPRTVEVETRDEPIRLLRGTDVVINTATTPAIPDLAGITESRSGRRRRSCAVNPDLAAGSGPEGVEGTFRIGALIAQCRCGPSSQNGRRHGPNVSAARLVTDVCRDVFEDGPESVVRFLGPARHDRRTL